jgi:hypothetical protein
MGFLLGFFAIVQKIVPKLPSRRYVIMELYQGLSSWGAFAIKPVQESFKRIKTGKELFFRIWVGLAPVNVWYLPMK